MSIYFDTEGLGFTGPLVLIQWSGGDEINLHEVMRTPVADTLRLVEAFADTEVCGFNLVHDWFQLTKWYNVLRRLPDHDRTPLDQLDDLKEQEARGPLPGDVCLKPVRACDLMLLARSGKYQHLAKHKPLLLRKVPTRMVGPLVESLRDQVVLPHGVTLAWKPTQGKHGRQDVVDLRGSFEGLSTSLKHLYSVITGTDQTGSFEEEVSPPSYQDVPDWRPWGGDWYHQVKKLADAFSHEGPARDYAVRDVHYTHAVWKDMGCPVGGDDDSELACLVGAAHWCGYEVAPRPSIERVIEGYHRDWLEFQDCDRRDAVMQSLCNHLDDTARMIVTDAKRTALEELARWQGHPVKEVAERILRAKQGRARKGLLQKLHKAGRFCFSMKVGGTLSSRMSGGSDQAAESMNAQGIPREKVIRELFPLAFPGEHLEGGDFDAYEVSIADAVYGDRQLAADIRSDRKFHAITGSTCFYPGMIYEEVLASKGTGPQGDKYVRAKNSFFAWLYQATAKKLAKVADLEVEQAEQASDRLRARYPGVAEHQAALREKLSPVWQEGGAGTKVHWRQPRDYVESILGFRRYFTLEWAVVKALYDLQEHPPRAWDAVRGECRRTDRVQTMSGATRSALFGAMFSVSSGAFRAAANHEIQSPGGQITKAVQRRVWDHQPSGVGPWVVRPLNVHDELPTPTTLPEGVLGETVQRIVEEFRVHVPMLRMGWSTLKDWSDK